MLNDFLKTVPPSAWTILVAVVTSIVSTVIVEYAAKPRLEARKARLLHNRSQLDEVMFGLQTLALHIGSLPLVPTGSSPLLVEVYKTQVTTIEKAAADGRSTLGRLSHRYAEKHGAHLRRTAYFLAYVETTAKSILSGESGADARMRAAGEFIEWFDVYFLVYLGLEDSAEPWIKRIFWRATTRKEYEAKSEEVAMSVGAPPTS